MRCAVLGATGTIGRLVCERASARGHEVVPLSRAGGVDALTGRGLDPALAGADVVVDCLDVKTVRARRAEHFFTTTAATVLQAAGRAGVGRLVVVSIACVDDLAVARALGYYRAKASQEEVYRRGPVPTTVVRSTQWFELVGDLVRRTRVGPVAVLPTMRIAPLAAVRAADLVVRQAEQGGGPAHRVATIRGPESMTAACAARVLSAAGRSAGRPPRLIGQLPYLGRAIAGGALVPREATVDDMTLQEWSRRPVR